MKLVLINDADFEAAKMVLRDGVLQECDAQALAKLLTNGALAAQAPAVAHQPERPDVVGPHTMLALGPGDSKTCRESTKPLLKNIREEFRERKVRAMVRAELTEHVKAFGALFSEGMDAKRQHYYTAPNCVSAHVSYMVKKRFLVPVRGGF